MPPSTGPSERKQALVAALQWGLVQAFVLDTLARLLRNYYRATTDEFLAPGWVYSIQFAALLGLLVGGIGGYRWVTSGRAATTASAHRDRAVFVGSLVAGWALAIVPTAAFEWLLGERLFTVPFFVLPTLVAAVVFVGSYLLAYRVGTAWYRRHRSRLLGAVAGAFAGLVLGVVGFVAYGEYLAATRTTYSLDGGPGIVACACLGGLAGYALADTERDGDRSAEFVVLFVVSSLSLTVLTALGTAALSAVGLSPFGVVPVAVLPVVWLVTPLAIAGYLAYWRQTALSERLVGR